MTIGLGADPLALATLPADRSDMELAGDLPSGSGSRPFGLTWLTTVTIEQLILAPSGVYDPGQQMSTDATGTPLINRPLEMTSVSTTKTTYDMTTVDDRDPDD